MHESNTTSYIAVLYRNLYGPLMHCSYCIQLGDYLLLHVVVERQRENTLSASYSPSISMITLHGGSIEQIDV